MFNKHIPALDGLRGFATIWVVLSHLDQAGLPKPLPGQTGEYGVFLFFILSGFLMGHLYLPQEFTATNLIKYGAARSSRIVPIYYLTIIFLVSMSFLIGKDFVYFMNIHDFIRHMAFFGNKYVYWSIGPEVQFYVVFIGIWYLYRTLTTNMVAVFPIAILAVAMIIFLQPFFPGTLVFSKFSIFAAGVIMAGIVAHLPSASGLSQVKSIWIAQITAISILIALTFTPFWREPILNPYAIPKDISFNAIYGDFRWIILMAIMLLILAIETPVSRIIFASRVARLSGTYSFSIYLLHVPVMTGAHNIANSLGWSVFGATLLALASVAAIGPLCSTLIEKPAQSWFRMKMIALGTHMVEIKSKALPA